MTDLTIVAHIQIDPERIDAMMPLFDTLIAGTRKEVGCICYNLHQDNSDPAHFMFYETWESRTLWQDHLGAPHLKAFQDAAGSKIISVQIHEMTQVPE